MKRLLAFLLFAVVCSTISMAQKADDVLGVWLTEDEDAKVEIYKKNDQYFGKIIWMKEPNNPDGSVKLDKENPEESLRSRKIMGLELLTGFEFDDDEWEDGEIYDAKSGKTYSCVMTIDGNTLNVRGYIGVSWVGRTTAWTRSE